MKKVEETTDPFMAEYVIRHGPMPSEEEMADDQLLRATVDSRIRALQWETDWKPQVDGFRELTGMSRQETLMLFMVQRLNDHVVASRYMANAVICIDNMLHHYLDERGEEWKHSKD
jgi:hypothetical protein